MVRHSSRIARNRSPAAFQWVALAARSSASAASASLRAVPAARCSSRRCRSAAAAESACSTIMASRAAKASTSPSTAAVGRVSASAVAEALILRASPLPAASRSSKSATSVLRSSNRRPKWAKAASGSPACHDPTVRSPAAVISQTVPSSSTRPNRRGSLPAGATTVGGGATAGFGPGPGRGTGLGLGVGARPAGSGEVSGEVMATVTYSRRGRPAFLPRSAAPSLTARGRLLAGRGEAALGRR